MRHAEPPGVAFWPQLSKMSEALEELIEPLLAWAEPEQQTLATVQKVLSLGALAWNLSVMHVGADLENELIRVTQTAGGALAADMRAALMLLIDRKRSLFPHDDRIVVDAQAYENESGFQITAASTLPPVR